MYQDACATAELRPPDLFASIQQQFDVKLEVSKDNLEAMVVDQVERERGKFQSAAIERLNIQS
jgi:hypothetical protein